MTASEKDISAKKKKPSPAKRIIKLLAWLIIIALLGLLILIIALNAYLKSDKEKLLEELGIINGGSIAFSSADLRVWEDFPQATIALNNFSLQDADYAAHEVQLLAVEKVFMTASLSDIRNRKMELQSIKLQDGRIDIFTDEEGFSNLKNIFPRGSSSGQESKFELLTKNVALSLSNIQFNYRNAINTNDIAAKINQVEVELIPNADRLDVKLEFDVAMDAMIFNKEKGAFAQNSRLIGATDLKVTPSRIDFTPFELGINSEKVLMSGFFDQTKKTQSVLTFDNLHTRMDSIRPLLLPGIQEALLPYQVIQPFKSRTVLTGKFMPGDRLLVEVQFELADHNVEITNKANAEIYAFEELACRGHFVNRLPKEQRVAGAFQPGISLALTSVAAKHLGFQLSSPSISIHSDPQNGGWIGSELSVQGQPEQISSWLENDKFFFQDGSFELQARVQGSMRDFNQMLLDSEATLQLNNFFTTYLPSNSVFPFKELLLVKKKGDASFALTSTTIDQGNEFEIDGGIQNFTSLLSNLPLQPSSIANFAATKMGWTDFINLFGKSKDFGHGQNKTDQEKKQAMKATLRGIQSSFQPIVSVKVDSLQYYDQLTILGLQSGMSIVDGHRLIIEETTFSLNSGSMSIQLELDIGQEDVTPFEYELSAKNVDLNELLPPLNYLNVKLLDEFERLPDDIDFDISHQGLLSDATGLIPHTSTGNIRFRVNSDKPLTGVIAFSPEQLAPGAQQSELGMGEALETHIGLVGDPVLFNQFFKTDQFFFDKGNFQLALDYVGDLTDITRLIQHSKASLSIQDSEVYYTRSGVTFPLSIVDLELDTDIADFEYLMRADSTRQEINISGKITNLSERIIGNTGKKISTDVNFLAKKIRWQKFLDIFSPKDSVEEVTTQNIRALKNTLRGLSTSFQPDLFTYVDTFVYSDPLQFGNLQVWLDLKDSTTLVIKQTGFDFYDGKISIAGAIDLSQPNTTPFSGNFKSESLDISALLRSLNYLGIASLRNTKKLEGSISMDFDMAAVLSDDSSGLIQSANDGQLTFSLKDIELEGYAPLDQLAQKIKLDRRFKNIKIDELQNVLNIKGGNIDIPLMEIQSNAVHVYVEGRYSYGDDMNIWISIPIKNLKRRDLTTVPDPISYAQAGRKVYLEVTSDENGENQFKFHLTKKKFYKQRGIKEQYKLDKKKWRQERRKAKKN